MRPRFTLLLPPLFVALLFAACSGESEGQPCNQLAGNDGNDDCQSPLVCTVVANASGARCCPQDRTTAKTPECALSSETFDGANPAPPDSSTTETASGEGAPAEASGSDGSVEGAAEAGVETGSAEAASDGSGASPDGAGD
jgi:hypothetical protein